MDENKKEYSIVGTVTIGSDEYRDLISDKIEAEKSRDTWNNRWYEERNKVIQLEKQIDALTAKIQKCEQFMKKNITNIPNDVMSVIFAEIGFGEE